MNYRRPRRESVSVDITPLIDVVFQLIIFLVVSTTFTDSPGIKVDLPQSQSLEYVDQSEQLSVMVQSDGKLYMEGKEVSQIELGAALEKRAQSDPTATLILNGDTRANLGVIVEIMDLSKRKGVQRIHIGAMPGKEDSEQ